MGVVDGGLQHLLFYKSSCLLYLHQGKLPWKSSARPMALLVKYKVDGDFLSPVNVGSLLSSATEIVLAATAV